MFSPDIAVFCERTHVYNKGETIVVSRLAMPGMVAFRSTSSCFIVLNIMLSNAITRKVLMITTQI